MMMMMTLMTMMMMMINLCSSKMKRCAFVFIHTPYICLALTIILHDKDHANHDEYDDPADLDGHNVLDHHDYPDDHDAGKMSVR